MAMHKTYWPLVLQDLKTKISANKWEAWFSSLRFEKIIHNGTTIVLHIPSKFNQTYIESRFKRELLDSITLYFPLVTDIQYTVDAPLEPQNVILRATPIFEDSTSAEKPLPSRYTAHDIHAHDFNTHVASKMEDYSRNTPTTTHATDESSSHSLFSHKLHNLNPKSTFESYVVTSFNELVVSVSKAILKQPGTLYNPLFIHSATGLGKTHLLQSLGHAYLEQYPQHIVKYVSAETFLNHYITSIQKGKVADFRECYRTVDLLLVDDIQFMSKKTSTQEMFFHTFNELRQLNKQIVISSDKSPKMMVGIEQRLISRFEWGMVVELSEPTVEDRLAIIRDKVQRRRMAVTDSQMLQIASSVQTNIRDIEGLLNKIDAYLRLHVGSFIDQTVLDKMLNPYLKMISTGLMHFSASHEAGQVTGEFEDIFNVVGKQWHVNKADMCSKKRDKFSVMARQAVMYILHRHCELSMATIGTLLGGRDHTTIVHGCQKIEKLLSENMDVQVKIKNALEELKLDDGLF